MLNGFYVDHENRMYVPVTYEDRSPGYRETLHIVGDHSYVVNGDHPNPDYRYSYVLKDGEEVHYESIFKTERHAQHALMEISAMGALFHQRKAQEETSELKDLEEKYGFNYSYCLSEYGDDF